MYTESFNKLYYISDKKQMHPTQCECAMIAKIAKLLKLKTNFLQNRIF